MADSEVSIVLPSYNEEGVLRDAVEKLEKRLEEVSGHEVIVVEDGCSDSTPEIADELAEEFDSVRHLHFEERQGRGRAVHKAFRQAEGDKLVYMDVDLSTDLQHLKVLLSELENHDLVAGSRYHEDSNVKRDWVRREASKWYNRLVGFLLGSAVDDHQCGFKGLTRECFEALEDEVESDHWFWDTELLLKAQKQGFEVKEIPVRWRRDEDSKVNLEEDVPNFTAKILWMKKKQLKKRLAK